MLAFGTATVFRRSLLEGLHQSFIDAPYDQVCQ
jgi:hypothetical protein